MEGNEGVGDKMREEEGEEAGGYVIQHDAGTLRDAFQVADWGGFEDVEEAEEEEG